MTEGLSSLAGQIHGAWPRLGAVLDTLAESVTIRDVDGKLIFANQAAIGSMGLAAEELLGRESAHIMADYIVQDEDGRPLTIEDVPSMRVIRGLESESVLMRVVNRETGTLSWRELKAAPLRDEDGTLIGAVTVIEDMTAVKNAEIRMRILAESGQILASSLDYGQTLENIANLAVPALADWCAVDFIDENLRRERVVVAHQDPAKRELAERVREFEPQELSPEDALARVLLTGQPELYPFITPEMVALGARGAEHRRLLEQLGMVSVVLVPMRVPARSIGVITLVTAESRRRLEQEDVDLAAQLGRRAGVAVENARLHTTLSEIAETLQRSLRPDEPPPIPGWEVATLYRPAGGQLRVDVGGDFYELFLTEAGAFAVIGDVTGKGIEAAAMTSLLRHGAPFAARNDPRPAAILGQLDAALRTRSDTSLCTALCLRLHQQGQVVLSSAGHPPALLVRPGGEVLEAPPPGPLLGAFADSAWPEQDLAPAQDDLLLLYTDGVTETPGTEERFGLERLTRWLAQTGPMAPAQLLARLDDVLQEFRRGEQLDDIAAVALRPSPGRR